MRLCGKCFGDDDDSDESDGSSSDDGSDGGSDGDDDGTVMTVSIVNPDFLSDLAHFISTARYLYA